VIEIRARPRDAVGAKAEHQRYWRIKLHPAAPSASLSPSQHDHLVADISEIFCDGVELIPGVWDSREELLKAVTSHYASALNHREERRNELEVGGGDLRETVQIAPVEGIYSSLRDLDFLLRNTRSPGPFHPSWVTPTAS
jgi:hypothetical protein